MLHLQHTMAKPHGNIIVAGEGHGECDTFQCVHCGFHQKVVRGSGKRRGYCHKCNGPTCGQRKCVNCLPQEKYLDRVEKGIIVP